MSMNYVDSFDLFGVAARQKACMPGSGAPTTTTVGAVGDLYMNTLNGDIYACTSVVNGVYTWTLTGGGSGTGASVTMSSVTILASAWGTVSESLHSQVVTIPGVTTYSKVDLLPSVEQLAIFHNKDVAFVTENEDGVVTVFAIGDKPANDYTIQVSITEVSV